MSYLLDTDICIYLMKGSPEQVIERFRRERPNNLVISSITVAELSFGAEKSSKVERNLAGLRKFLQPFQVHTFGTDAARAYGKVRLALERSGTPTSPLDTLIAAHALSLEATLVTDNIREFSRVPDLSIENWLDV